MTHVESTSYQQPTTQYLVQESLTSDKNGAHQAKQNCYAPFDHTTHRITSHVHCIATNTTEDAKNRKHVLRVLGDGVGPVGRTFERKHERE